MGTNLMLWAAQLDVLIRPENEARVPGQRVANTLQAISTPCRCATVRSLKQTYQTTSATVLAITSQHPAQQDDCFMQGMMATDCLMQSHTMHGLLSISLPVGHHS